MLESIKTLLLVSEASLASRRSRRSSACSVSSLFSRSSYSSKTAVGEANNRFPSLFLLALSFRPFLPSALRHSGVDAPRKRGRNDRSMTKWLPPAPLVNSDHDSRTAADHRSAKILVWFRAKKWPYES